MKPIETYYKGYRFRSRLEARWAVFFDALGVKYDYEPEGFTQNGVYYLPDFRIYDVEGIHGSEWRQDIYVEVKGEPDAESARKVAEFSWNIDYGETSEHGLPIWVVGNIPDPDDYIEDTERQRYERCQMMRSRDIPDMCALCINDFGPLDGDSCFQFALDYTDHRILRGDDSSYGYGRWSEEVSHAFAKARQARFEHGEKPNF